MSAIKRTVHLRPGGKLELDIPADIEAGTYELKLVLRLREADANPESEASAPALYAGFFTNPPFDVPLSDPSYMFTREQIYEDEDDVDLR